MVVTVSIAFISAVLLVSIRLAAALVPTPILSMGQVPAQFRALFVIALSAVLVSRMPSGMLHIPDTLGGLTTAALSEVVVGGLLAFGIVAAFAAFQLGGRILDMQIGFGVANLIDPVTQTQAPMLGTILYMIAIMVFFTVNGHLLLLQAILFSLKEVPPGTMPSAIHFGAIVVQFGVLFVYSLAVVAPAMLGVLLLDAGLGVVSRTMPQVNIFIVSLPIKISAGLALLAVSVYYFAPLMRHVFESIFSYWTAVL